MDIAAALRALPRKNPPEGAWKGVLERHEATRRPQQSRRRYWAGGLAVAASAAVAVVGLRLGAGVFFGAPESREEANAALQATVSENASREYGFVPGAAVVHPAQLDEMDMDALIALSRFQETRLRMLPAVDGPGSVVELDTLGLATELEDRIALLDEGLIPASMNLDDRAVPRRLLQQRAMLMDDLFSLRRAEVAQAGFMHADF